jgi:hypothetical protein
MSPATKIFKILEQPVARNAIMNGVPAGHTCHTHMCDENYCSKWWPWEVASSEIRFETIDDIIS